MFDILHLITFGLLNLVVVCIYAFLLNKEFLFNTLNTVTSKFKKNK